MTKGTAQAKATLTNENIQPTALVFIELHLKVSVSKSVTQPVSQYEIP